MLVVGKGSSEIPMAFFYGTIPLNRPLSGALIRTFNNHGKQFLLNMMNKQIIEQSNTKGEGLLVEATTTLLQVSVVIWK